MMDMESNSLNFVEAKESDLQCVIALLADDILGEMREANDEGSFEAYQAAFQIIQADENAKLIVVKCDEKIIGMAQINFITYLTYQGGKRAQVEGVRTHRDFRSQGVGKQLFDHLIQLAKQEGCHVVQLTTDKLRPDAYQFYQKLGFVNSHDGFKLHLKGDGVI